VAEHEDLTEIEWVSREDRYGEKLATPDITIADLIGDVDPIKVAEGRYLSDELTIHYGLLPRTNRGIFCINELPDLAERVQVGLLNVLEERDVQIRGYKVRLPLDVYLVASANPEDYTNRGRIITPLKDRAGSQIKTHYPTTLDHEIDIMEQERMTFTTPGYEVEVPQYMKEIVAEVTHLARRHPDISQRSGVSVRVSIANFENLVSNALKRAIKLNEHQVVPRVSDMAALAASTAGKIELESVGDVREEKVVDKLVQGAVLAAWNRRFSVGDFDDVVTRFHNGLVIEAGDTLPSMEYVHQASDLKGIRAALAKLEVGSSPSAIAAAVEFILEGLHLNRRLNKDRTAEGTRYRR
jgi:magnesium chelatase subunit I